jgi:hypothetical protein
VGGRDILAFIGRWLGCSVMSLAIVGLSAWAVAALPDIEHPDDVNLLVVGALGIAFGGILAKVTE